MLTTKQYANAYAILEVGMIKARGTQESAAEERLGAFQQEMSRQGYVYITATHENAGFWTNSRRNCMNCRRCHS